MRWWKRARPDARQPVVNDLIRCCPLLFSSTGVLELPEALAIFAGRSWDA